MKIIRYSLFLSAICSSTFFAQEVKPNPETTPPSLKIIMDRLKVANPEKAKELEELRNNNPEEFRKKIRELIQHHPEFPQAPNPDRLNFWLKDLEKNNPEKFRELMELKESNPPEFRKKALELISENLRKVREEEDNLRNEIRVLVKEYQKATSDEEKNAAKAKVREKLTLSFEQDLARRKERIEKLEDYLIDIKSQINEREVQKEALINKQLELILGEKKEEPKKPE